MCLRSYSEYDVLAAFSAGGVAAPSVWAVKDRDWSKGGMETRAPVTIAVGRDKEHKPDEQIV